MIPLMPIWLSNVFRVWLFIISLVLLYQVGRGWLRSPLLANRLILVCLWFMGLGVLAGIFSRWDTPGAISLPLMGVAITAGIVGLNSWHRYRKRNGF